ncbi:caspase family protein [Lutibacter sp.]|uniref:caspase family protein n=1 Tax=Lutibacter sp. TaxID=1925666 RepID=UPI001A2FF8C7|nr:caspase family protein [Lutibacter sp.]MBI9042388.1 caspase family protein [Lutibacter sp.]
MEKLNNAYALLIGVKDDKLDTLIDAKGIYDMLVDENLSAYHPDNIIFLSGEETTRKHILEAFDKLQQMTNEESSVFLYYTGHGGYGLGEYFIQPYGIVASPVEAVKNSWVSASELKEKLMYFPEIG